MAKSDLTSLELWQRIDALRASGADPNKPEPFRKRLAAALATLGDDELGRFIGQLRAVRAALSTRAHWLAASLLEGRECCDADFDDFRSWVVAHGADAFARVLADPDAIAALAPAGSQGVPVLKPLVGTTWKAYEKREHTDAIDAQVALVSAGVDPDADVHIGWRYWDAPTAVELERTLPRTWARRGATWHGGGGDTSFVKVADVAGLGSVRIGDRLIRRGTGEAFEVLGITDQSADLSPGVTFVGGDDFRFVGRVRLDSGETICGQLLGGRYQRWPHEPDVPRSVDTADQDDEADDASAIAYQERDDAIQKRVKKALGKGVRVVFAAHDEDADGLPVDNLDDVAHEGDIRFVEVDDSDGERFESETLTNPTWLDLARVADTMIRTLGYLDYVYLEGFDVVRKARAKKPATGRFVLGS